jgi:hypothetical protein
MTTEYTTQDYVRASIAGDAVKAKEIFNQLMAPKLVDTIDATKHEVAQNYFGKPEVEPVAQSDEASQDDEQSDTEQVTDNEEEKDEIAQ